MMTTDQINQLKAIIVYMNEYYQRPAISDMVLKMYASDLADMHFESVIDAYERYRKNPRNKTTPLPSVIRELINPEIDDDSLAVSTASKVSEAVTKFGYCNPSDAKGFVGELGWAAVRRYGGWTEICDNLGTSKLPKATFMAQIREIAKADIKIQKSGGSLTSIDFNEKKQITSSNVINLLTMKEVPK